MAGGTQGRGRERGRPRWLRWGVAALVCALAPLLVVLTGASAVVFRDVPQDHPYAAAISDLAERGIIAGYGDGRFGPADPVMRQQFAKIAVLSFELPVTEGDVCPFGDVDASGAGSLYPDNFVAAAAREGITNGTSPERFSPYRDITRFQVVSMVIRGADAVLPGVVPQAPAGFVATWDPAQSPEHGANARRAEAAGLLAGLPLEVLDPWAPMPRGEVAQVLHNLLAVVAPSTTTTTEPATTSTTEPTTSTTEPQPELIPISELKGPEWRRYQGRTVTVEGIFVRDPLPMLVTDLDRLRANAPLPEDQHVLLGGRRAYSLDPEELGGAVLRVTGRVGTNAPGGADGETPDWVALLDVQYQVVERLAVYAPRLADIPVVYTPDPAPRRWAILFSGGINAKKNHTRYWNDLKFMYSTLVGPLGFPPNNVAVLYADGTAKDSSMPVHYSATLANLQVVFDLLREHDASNDLIFVFTTNHGGGFHTGYTGSSCLQGGELDANSDETGESLWEKTFGVNVNGNASTTDFFSWDESLCQWQGASSAAPMEIMDDALQPVFSDLTFNRMVVVMEQCFSGGLIHDVARGGNRIIMSAAGEHEFSWAMNSPDYDEFSYYFTCAIRKSNEKGVKVDADTDKNGEVSLVEAFNYARSHDTSSETPWYEDSGDGIPHSGAMPSGGEGTLGGGTSLEP